MPRSAFAEGSARFTIDASSTTISWAMAITPRAYQRLGSGTSVPRSDGGLSDLTVAASVLPVSPEPCDMRLSLLCWSNPGHLSANTIRSDLYSGWSGIWIEISDLIDSASRCTGRTDSLSKARRTVSAGLSARDCQRGIVSAGLSARAPSPQRWGWGRLCAVRSGEGGRSGELPGQLVAVAQPCREGHPCDLPAKGRDVQWAVGGNGHRVAETPALEYLVGPDQGDLPE